MKKKKKYDTLLVNREIQETEKGRISKDLIITKLYTGTPAVYRPRVLTYRRTVIMTSLLQPVPSSFVSTILQYEDSVRR